MKVFARKATAFKYLRTDQILCNLNIKKYFILKNHQAFADLIETTSSPTFYEFIKDDSPVNLFFDIEIYRDKNPKLFNNDSLLQNFKQNIKTAITSTFNETQVHELKIIILQAHSEQKRSYHIVVRMTSDSGIPVYFKNVKEVKAFVTRNIELGKLSDTSVYREGLFRTYLSTKENEQRPLVKDTESDHFEFVETFVTYTPSLDNCQLITLPTTVTTTTNDNDKDHEHTPESVCSELNNIDKECIQKFIRKNYKYRTSSIRDIFIDRTINCIIVALDDTFCHNIDREHKSNHQYIVIDAFSSKQKCHDKDCIDYKHQEIKINQFPKQLIEIILRCLKVNKHEQELIEKAVNECKEYISNNFDSEIDEIQFDKSEMVFRGNASDQNGIVSLRGKCNICRLEHRITNDGYCLKCKVCDSIYPKNQLIPLDEKYKHLNKFWMNYNQLVNNGNIIINNYYNGEEEFTCDIQLDNSIFKNKELTKLYNQILDGHKVVVISQLMSKLEVDFKYTNGDWYFFNGSIWKQDKESLEFRKRIVNLSNNFSRIQQYYESKGAGDNTNINIIKNVKSLINKLHKTGFEDEIIKGAKMYYNDESFTRNLNSKKHLIPFVNGVFDLLENKFRKTIKEDYVNLILGFDFNPNVSNSEVHEFIDKVLPNKRVQDYVLKKMSECLNGDIPNTNFLMYIGDGANGKSQLLNLMKLAMGELGEKVEVTLLTRKRNNANEANTEKIKLMNKRFAFLSEPEDGEKINIGLLKELTGSEEIVARGLYQESVSFVMEAKLFLACNELPEIKGEDTALWRRIRVIDFPSRFVDDPKESNEFKIDRTLPSRMREDITWRQTFVNILIDYYYKDIKEPDEVKLKTNEYREENNHILGWINEHIEMEMGSRLLLKDVCIVYFNHSKVSVKEKGRLKKELEKHLKTKYPNINCACMRNTINGDTFQGWLNFKLKE